MMKDQLSRVLFLVVILLVSSCAEGIMELNECDSSVGCPAGYVAVPGNSSLNTTDFCVAKYEMKNIGGHAISVSTSAPWVSISAQGALEKCNNLSKTNHRGYCATFTLISNAEWMTIARNIETVDSNWSGGSVGNGYIPAGNSDNFIAVGRTNPLDIQNENDPYDGTFNSSSEIPGSGWEQKRTHTLSNGEIIWDFSGNVWEWVNWEKDEETFNLGPIDATPSWMNLDNLTMAGSVTENDLQSALGYDQDQYMGKWYGGTNGAAKRGGQWDQFTDYYPGIFSLHLDSTPNTTNVSTGFRCVYHPDRPN